MLPEIERVDAVEQLARIGLEARIHFRAGRTEEARRVLDLWIAYAERTPPGAVRYLFLASIGEALPALADDEVVTAIYEELCGWPENRVAGWRSLDGYRAMLALHLGRHDEAREHVATGRAWAADQQAPVELGRMLVTDAALANEEGRALDGLHDLDRAAELFAQHDAGLYVEDVIRLKLELQGASASVDAGTSIEAVSAAVTRERPTMSGFANADGTVTLMFSDIVGSTTLNQRLGDERWLGLLREHNQLIRDAIANHGGNEVKVMGDGFMVAFSSANEAVRCAMELQDALRGRNAGAETPVPVRVGLHTGELMRADNDFIGHHVNVAARIGGLADGDEILVSRVLRDLSSPTEAFAFAERGERELRGIEGSFELFAVEWERGATP